LADANRRRVEAQIEIRGPHLVLGLLESRASGDDRQLHALGRAEVVDELRLRVRETKLDLIVDEPIDHQIEVALTRRYQPRAALGGKRSFDDD
jgi:hypothetical protein